jgi:hypothetical protein
MLPIFGVFPTQFCPISPLAAGPLPSAPLPNLHEEQHSASRLSPVLFKSPDDVGDNVLHWTIGHTRIFSLESSIADAQ